MLNFESSKIKFITWLLLLSLLSILSEAPTYNTATCICSQNVKNTHLSITQTKTQIVDPYPKIRKQNPRNPKTKPSKISRNFLPPNIKRLLLGLVSYDVFPTDVLRWRGRFHNHVQYLFFFFVCSRKMRILLLLLLLPSSSSHSHRRTREKNYVLPQKGFMC